ncbi:beta-lactamase hydrolase domain-containing protein [Oscillatoria sp. HE19RPO]|uniref:beta-lactamase hydrolase domain-containing protein n=1 Tax=Oscillatoria sp. HE19RPO TaxID=2954806 RepID=UPI0020C59A99|nr:protein tyrosine phosphatase family protein [Oscillatoria sp. HE19RPO]
MENIKKIRDDLAIAMNQLTGEQVQQASQEGFKSILNLRSPQEEGFSSEEQQQAESAGLHYVNIPVKPDAMDDQLADRVLQEIDQLPKPALIHCKSGMRSGALTLMYIATQEGISAEQAMTIGKQHDFDCDAHPQMKQFFEHYISTHAQAS